MKKLWVNVVPYEKGLAIAALESGAEAVVLPEGESDKGGRPPRGRVRQSAAVRQNQNRRKKRRH
jgi:hypothetical protein